MSIHYQAAKYGRELSLPEAEVVENEPAASYARRVKLKAKYQALEQLKSKWEEKPLQNPQLVSTPGLKSKTEGFIIAAQDQCIKTNYYRDQILKDGTDPMCRICGQFQETADHLVSGCPELAKTEYIQRHNKAAAYLRWTIRKHYNVKVQDKHYEHEPATVTENQTATILWDMPIQSDKEIKANRPVVVKDKKEKTCLLIDMSIPTERNTSLKTMEKLTKYKDLEIEIDKTWGMKTTTVPVIIGAFGLIEKGTENCIGTIPGNIRITELQKTVLLGTAHMLRRTLYIK